MAPESSQTGRNTGPHCLFKNWRLGPEKLPDTHINNVLLAGYSRFGNKTPKEFIDRWYPNNTTQAQWPNPQWDGFLSGPPQQLTILRPTPGTKVLIDRFGKEDTPYFAPFNTAFANRSLSPASLNFTITPEAELARRVDDSDADMYRVYEIAKPFEVFAGACAPGFEQPGGGTQYVVKDRTSARGLVEGGFLRRLRWEEVVALYKGIVEGEDRG
ncbi:hypothetical protein CkaCkLH20_05739 [Colletotrichum karsti]|uniref:TNT domain-containing protein n=1 Tax=Colletotrichum karsti TaxID=1095194 RepID=A0A9P6I3Y2_9PEZI|nr:uncharacterized protein CkaCkLH20_05739 [Colletotrichum karsti]KAF9876893.1 hypothetical protein CkaCkLH20_05739 [Colletotrichum karsti]